MQEHHRHGGYSGRIARQEGRGRQQRRQHQRHQPARDAPLLRLRSRTRRQFRRPYARVDRAEGEKRRRRQIRSQQAPAPGEIAEQERAGGQHPHAVVEELAAEQPDQDRRQGREEVARRHRQVVHAVHVGRRRRAGLRHPDQMEGPGQDRRPQRRMQQVRLADRRRRAVRRPLRQPPEDERAHALGDQLALLREVARQLGFLHRAGIAQPLEVREGVERGHCEREQREERRVDDFPPRALIHLVDQVLHAGFEC